MMATIAPGVAAQQWPTDDQYKQCKKFWADVTNNHVMPALPMIAGGLQWAGMPKFLCDKITEDNAGLINPYWVSACDFVWENTKSHIRNWASWLKP